jgi:microcin C transport system substrate-binding protein
MHKWIRVLCAVIVVMAATSGCSQKEEAESTKQETQPEAAAVSVEDLPEYPVHELPEGLEWITNNDEPIFSSPQAKKGGTLRAYLMGFPLTLRSAGPDSSGIFANYIHNFQMGLTSIHPNTLNPIPSLATHWAFDEDGVTVYYKLDPNARWSDGRPVTADDYLFSLEFGRSKFIVSPVMNDHYTRQILAVKKYDDHTISITGANKRPKNDLLYYYGMGPTPRHFHKLDENWVSDYNWKIEPNTGPYQISKVRKGKFVEFSRKKDWWAKDYRYMKNRYNVDKIHTKVIRELQIAFEHFLRGELDTYWMVWPDFWHDKATGDPYDKGYIHKIQFYNETPQPMQGYHLNNDFSIFSDKNARYGFAHALNVRQVIDTLIRGDYQRANTAAEGYGEYSNKKVRAREYDLALAEKYLRMAGWENRGPDGILVKDGNRFSVTMTYGQNNLTERIVLLREEAKKAGIELNLELLDSSSSFKKIREKKHQIASVALVPGFRPSFWGVFHSDNAHKPNTMNASNTDDPELDRLIDAYRFGTEEEERKRLAREITAKIHDTGSYIPTYSVPFTRHSYWRWIKLPEFHATRMTDRLFPPNDEGLFWIDEAEKERTLKARRSGEAFEPVTIIDTTYKVK